MSAAVRARRRIAVVGASGYTGRELAELVARHPSCELVARYSARVGVEPPPPASPVEPRVERLDLDALRGLDGVFLCAPHGVGAPIAEAALAAGAKVVDLSADFRLADEALHARVYGAGRSAQLAERAVYGLTEHARGRVREADFVANPGCYPTAVLLALLPLVEAGLVDLAEPVIADCKSGLSGAGKEPSARTHFGAVHDNFSAYGVGTHRHQPEIEQEARGARVVFVPHLLPVFRGILATMYVAPARGVAASDALAALSVRYADERFVRVYERGMPELAAVQHTNQCHIGAADAYGRIVLVSCIDNLVKGAAGQALQNMNLMLGCDEAEGLS